MLRSTWMMLALAVAGCSLGSTESADDDEGADETSTAVSADDLETAPPIDPADEGISPEDAANLATPHLQAFFATPKVDGTPDPTLDNKIAELLALANKGSRVRVAMFHWTRTGMAQKFVDASNRGVDVEVVLDRQANETLALAPIGDGEGPEPADLDDEDELAKGLGTAVVTLQKGLPAGAITFCTRGDGSCIGTHINHNKIYMFSSLSDGSKYVVVQSSANLTSQRLHNNLVISRNDKALYDGYVTYFNALKRRKANANYYRSVTGDHAISYFYPRASGDTIETVLGKVKCGSASKIRVAMAFFTDGRAGIAADLVRLRKAGCDVQVVMRKAGTNSSANIIRTLKSGGVKVGLYPDAHANIHSKYLLIDSKYDTQGKGFVRRRLVFTGSHNYTGGALRDNDEVLMRVDNGAVFDAFMANWAAIRRQIP